MLRCRRQWRVRLRVKPGASLGESILSWIQRDIDVQLKNTDARQGYLEMGGCKRFDPHGILDERDENNAVGHRSESFNGMATGAT